MPVEKKCKTIRVFNVVRIQYVLAIVMLGWLLPGCDGQDEKTLFQLLPSSVTGIAFKNELTETDSFNVLSFEYIYNGAGVGVGDVNNDGLTDIFFAGNMVSSALYLNKGNFKFDDISESASIKTKVWCTGVSMVDINQDGLLDVYISTIQPYTNRPPVPNLLYLNKGVNQAGIPVFEEVAAKVGLADSSYATQAAFLDYDLDGDLDMYMLTNALESYNRNQIMGLRNDGTGKSVDKFYRNDGVVNGLPVFKDVSAEVGVQAEGWGLGIVVNDINRDGYPDLYIANDFMSNDHLYINTGDGKFVNTISSMLKHQEQNGMGIDIADINNDALNDIVVLDMLPDDNLRQKTMFSTVGYDRFRLFREKGYQYQYIRNVLQLNNGNNTFSDIGYFSGIYATDWSWSSLFADFDNDGYRDLFVGNGYRKDVTDQDFIAYGKELAMFSTDRNRMKHIRQEVEKLPGVRKPNFLFRNNGDLTFTDKAKEWGLDQPSYSNGAAYADLDNDGDLDLVTNNINDEAFVYRNDLITAETKSDHHFLRIKLQGEKGNLAGYGTTVSLYANAQVHYAEHQTIRGYKSTVENIEHVGLGKVPSGKVDSIKIMWPGGKSQTLRNVPVNQVITVKMSDAVAAAKNSVPSATVLTESHQAVGIYYKHHEEEFVDFLEGQFLLPHKHSQGGPGITVGDVNGDGLDDFILGGSAGKCAKIFLQQGNGSFKTDSLPAKVAEDMGVLLFDADYDGDLDLYCVSGSSEFKRDKVNYQDRFYRNSGKGKFVHDTNALPELTSSGSCVAANDFDRDGDLDLFVGGRVVPLRYPEAPESYILVNNGNGKFENKTSTFSSVLGSIGMVTSAIWSDVNNDNWTDLVLVGEWMPITFFINEKGKSFTPLTLENSAGWWNSISGGDFDNDGDIDYIAGNLGRNSIYKASDDEPVTVYAKDFDNNGSVDPILCRYIQGKEHPVHPREALTGQIPGLRGVALRYSLYGGMGIQDLLSKEKLENSMVLKSTMLSSVYIQNNGNNNFEIKPLPPQAQFSPMFGMLITDLDEDGNLDILSVGNSYASEVLSGYYDAGIGNYLQGDGKGNFKAVPVTQSGFFVDGDAKAIAKLISKQGRELFLVTQNRDSLKVYMKPGKITSGVQSVVRVKPDDEYAIVELANGKKRKEELYIGSGYLSSSSRAFVKNRNVSKVTTSGRTPEKR
ncbi:VCBS repeat-containing protein [Ohtaekwangia koreensis]|uniref:Repeat domain-containing protein n=1 Tax=Ohtaekwangia koreensis TaxID=688867 RepID=A0A1T5M052_9BACT|nr:VCBS repeat-containing protein [Ohtaekwangia koreensis]SKC81515.1 Repeat domain-containing protein [Ohtaekwangia koreensis]